MLGYKNRAQISVAREKYGQGWFQYRFKVPHFRESSRFSQPYLNKVDHAEWSKLKTIVNSTNYDSFVIFEAVMQKAWYKFPETRLRNAGSVWGNRLRARICTRSNRTN